MLRRIIDGERGEDLLTGLDPTDTLITRRALAALAGTVQLTATLDDLDDLLTPQVPSIPEEWQQVIDTVVDAAGGDTQATTEIAGLLDELTGTDDWAALAAVLRRILEGERGDQLLDGLDPTDTAITTQILTHLAPPTTPTDQEDSHD